MTPLVMTLPVWNKPYEYQFVLWYPFLLLLCFCFIKCFPESFCCLKKTLLWNCNMSTCIILYNFTNIHFKRKNKRQIYDVFTKCRRRIQQKGWFSISIPHLDPDEKNEDVIISHYLKLLALLIGSYDLQYTAELSVTCDDC